MGPEYERLFFSEEDYGVVCIAQRRRALDEGVQNLLKVESRAADHLEHVGGGGLLLQRFTQLVEQASVLDGDDGLGGEVRDQLDLFAGERPYLPTINSDRANQLV